MHWYTAGITSFIILHRPASSTEGGGGCFVFVVVLLLCVGTSCSKRKLDFRVYNYNWEVLFDTDIQLFIIVHHSEHEIVFNKFKT